MIFCLGYEEAAAQGLVAGANAAARTRNHFGIGEYDPLVLDRMNAYIGVMVDDLVRFPTFLELISQSFIYCQDQFGRYGALQDVYIPGGKSSFHEVLHFQQ